MYHVLVRILKVMYLLDAEIREHSLLCSWDTEFCPELEEHFELFEQMIGFHVTIVSSANTQPQYETLPLWSGLQKEASGTRAHVGATK